jgi:hypothetical protein
MTAVVTLPAPGRGRTAYNSLRERLGGTQAASIVAVLEAADSFMERFAAMQQGGLNPAESMRWLRTYGYGMEVDES